MVSSLLGSYSSLCSHFALAFRDNECARACKNVSSCICGQQGPDQPAHWHSLIRAFAVCSQDNGILINVSVEAKCPDETLCICMM